MKAIYKYPTGSTPPDGAIYLSTVTQTEIEVGGIDANNKLWEKCWLVWHYFLVEVDEPEKEKNES